MVCNAASASFLNRIGIFLYCQILDYTFTKNITKPGHNSFTASQIKTYLTRSGFKDIKRLRLDDKGIWCALVEFKKCHFFISIDYSGTINIKNESDVKA
ncbi:hypothetical protein [Bartonella sp. CB175]|uniref:hypothetical protein n=1 Tax=Bartonella sp. CB175 TaxID=3112256 RepID=UPI003FA5FE3A